MNEPRTASAPLGLVLAGSEVAALGPLVHGARVALALALEATASVRASTRWIVRDERHVLLVEPDLPPPADEGRLALEASILRHAVAHAPHREPVELEVLAPDFPELGAIDARARASFSALGIPHDATLAVRAGSTFGVLEESPGARALRESLLVARDPHEPRGPSGRLALVRWHEGEHEPLRRAAALSKQCAHAIARGAPVERVAALVDAEAHALEVLAPRCERDRRLAARLRAAGALAVRPLGERGLMALLFRDRERLEHEARALGLVIA